MMLRALLADMRVVRLTESEALLSVAPHARSVAENKLDDLSKLLTELTGRTVHAKLTNEPHQPEKRADAPAPSEPQASPDLDHPIVKKTLEMFNGRIIDVKPMRVKPRDEQGEI